MKLSECKLGEVVTSKETLFDKDHELRHLQIGHIVGFTLNYASETIMKLKLEDMSQVFVIPLVKFPFKDVPIGIHYVNLIKYED